MQKIYCSKKFRRHFKNNKVIKHNELNENMKYSLRSSTWKLINGTWKMFFHQGTLTTKF